jgi:undecaprenyl-diphosphatase
VIDMMDVLKHIDEELFLFLNGLHNDFFDFVMHWITLQETWYPFYAVLIIWMIWRFKQKAIIPIIIIVLAITISDQFTSSFMKPFFERLRPCHEPAIAPEVHVVDGCGGLYGFASSHASNSFALATLLFLFFRHIFKYASLFFVWAAAVSYSRVYVGVHYPGDILVGGLLGILIGIILFYSYLKLPPKYKLNT